MNGADLTPFLQPKDPAGPSMNVRYRQGTVLLFNPITLENTVDVGGSPLVNLPLLGVAEASSLVAGAVVGLMAIESTTGLTTYAILGRLVTPASAAAAEAVSLLNSWVHTAKVAVQETRMDLLFGDLATVGPSVDVPVRATGRVLIFITSQSQWIDLDATDGNGGSISVEMSGANTMTALAMFDQLAISTFAGSSALTQFTLQVTSTASAVVEGLAPGMTKFVMKYRTRWADESVDFGRRSLVVISL